MKNNLRKLEASLILIMKVLVYVSLFGIFYGVYSVDNWWLLNLSRTAAVTIMTFAIAGYLFLRIYGGYDIGRRKSKPIIYSLSLAVAMTDIITWIMLSIMNTNANNNTTFELEQPSMLFVIILAQIILIIIFVYGGNYIYFKLYEPDECIIITSSKRSLCEIASVIRKYKLQYRIYCAVDYRVEGIREKIIESDAVFIYDVPVKERTEIVEFCYQNMIKVFFNPSMSDVLERRTEHVILDDMSLFGADMKGLTLEQRFVKRFSDLLIAGLALIITSPLLLVAAILIKIEDKGPIFFKQNRATRNGRIFSVYKIRTMKVDSDNYSSIENDDRITKVGRVLRKYRIDEIPQFINVILGDMSVVGPRPEMLANIFNYTSELPEFEYRLRVKAGITGYAQIAGKYNTSPRDKLILDLMYIEEYSMWLDIKLLFQTLIVLLKRDSTEAFRNYDDIIFDEYEEPQE